MCHRTIFILIFVCSAFAANAQISNADYLANYADENVTEISIVSKQQSFFDHPNMVNKNYSTEFLNKTLTTVDRHPLEKTGRILTFVGIPLTIIGAIMVSSADELYYNCYNGVCEGDPQGGVGVVLLAAGVGMTGTGIVLWTIGKKKR